jgi:hypothetical protein
MNKKCALIKSLLKGDVIDVSNSIRLTGLSNPSRELGRMVERAFNVTVEREKINTKDQWGNHAMYFKYRFNPFKKENKEGTKKMVQYVKEHSVKKN